jgi:DNA modification methylase
MHPTVKPLPLLIDALKDCTRRGDVVLDTFCGSGSTLMACERIGRNAVCVDIEPRYVDVTIRRWQDYTGKDAVHLASGFRFDELTGKVRRTA